MMKILIIANSFLVFGKELKYELERCGDEVTLLDFEHLYLFTKEEQDESVAKKFASFKKLPKASMFFRLYFIWEVIKRGDYDVVNIHYNRWYYRWLMPYFSHIRTKLVISTYGSDFYRASVQIRNKLRLIYQRADAVTFTNEMTKEAFADFYQDFSEKSHICRFGLKTLEYIDKKRDIDRESMRMKLGYDTGKIIVTCGYNATSAQQHFKMIKVIEQLESDVKKKCQFVFPLTYGDDVYKREVIKKLASVKFDFVVLEAFLYGDDNAYVKLASDIMINVLETDSFSGSMQEFLYANNVVIAGSWLPYRTFDDAGVFYLKIDRLDALTDRLSFAVQQLDTLRARTEVNRKIIASLSAWCENIDAWRTVFEGKPV